MAEFTNAQKEWETPECKFVDGIFLPVEILR